MEKGFTLKANLLEKGIKVTTNAKKVLDKQSDIWLMDDYITCSGVTLKYGDEYATIGVENNSIYELIAEGDKLFLTDGSDDKIEISVITPPDYMRDEMIIDGKKITVYVNTYTDRTRLQLMSGCTNNCKFCNAVEYKYELNSIRGMEAALEIALEQSQTRHLLISSGSVRQEHLEIITKMYEHFTKKYKDLDVDIMMTPRGFTSYTDSSQYEAYIKHLKDIGVHGLSINMELNHPEYLKKYCPEKFAIGQENYLNFLETAVKIFGPNKVRSLLIVGIEPLEETLEGVRKLAMIGVNPVLSPLFPYGEANFPPKADLFIEAKEKSLEICREYNVEMGPLCKPCTHNVL